MRKLIAKLLAWWHRPDVVEIKCKGGNHRLFRVRADGAQEAVDKVCDERALWPGSLLYINSNRLITTVSAVCCSASHRVWLVNVEALLLGCIAGEDLRKFQPVRYASDGTVVAMGSDA